MSRHLAENINYLIQTLPRGSFLTTQYLKQQGISTKLAWWYVKSGWFKHVGEGLYQLAGERPTWVSVIHALQSQLNLPIHIGGKSALQRLGQAHYLPFNNEPQNLQLFSPLGIKPPTWFKSEVWQKTFLLTRTQLFGDGNALLESIVARDFQGFDLKLSSPERAVMELCYLTPKHMSFHELALTMEHLSRLRPNLVQKLLDNCSSIKVKRLFLFLADYFQHPWLDEIVLDQIELGQGKRVIAGGGEYHAKYAISVPKITQEGDESD